MVASGSGPAPPSLVVMLFMSVSSLLRLVLRSNTQKIPFLTWVIYCVVGQLLFSGLVFPFLDGSKIDSQSVALWVPFFLLHSSGINTLNAYSLYLAALLMIGNVIASVFVLCQSSLTGEMFVVVFPVLFIAIYNYGERIWVHSWRGMDSHFQESVQLQIIRDDRLRFERSGIFTTKLRLHKPPTPINNRRSSWLINGICSIAGMIVSFVTFIFFVDNKNLLGLDIFLTYQLFIVDIIVRGCSLFSERSLQCIGVLGGLETYFHTNYDPISDDKSYKVKSSRVVQHEGDPKKN